MWTGRCEVWRWGRSAPGQIHEYDLRLAYCHIAAERRLPHALAGRVGELSEAQLQKALERYAVLAEVEVDINLPLVPHGVQKRIQWPVGRFRTTLWDPELRTLLAREQGVTVLRAWLYDRSASLQGFSRWLLAACGSGQGPFTPLQRRALKHFSRTLIGRFALRYQSWERHCKLPDFGLRLGTMRDESTGVLSETLHVGHELLELGAMTDAEDALPQVTGWVMSEARARLWRLCELAGLQNVLYVDTDSLLVNDEGARKLERWTLGGFTWSLERKATYPHVEISAPRQLRLGRRRRVAGVPLRAVEVSPGVYEGETWRSIHESMARGEGDVVVVEPGRWELAGSDPRRIHLPGGRTAPHAVS